MFSNPPSYHCNCIVVFLKFKSNRVNWCCPEYVCNGILLPKIEFSCTKRHLRYKDKVEFSRKKMLWKKLLKRLVLLTLLSPLTFVTNWTDVALQSWMVQIFNSFLIKSLWGTLLFFVASCHVGLLCWRNVLLLSRSNILAFRIAAFSSDVGFNKRIRRISG